MGLRRGSETVSIDAACCRPRERRDSRSAPVAVLAGPTAAQEITLTFLRHEHPPANELEKELIQQFQQENPNVKIEYVTVPDVDLFTKYQAMTVAGTPPDIVNFGSTDIPAVWQRGQLAPVDLSAVGVASLEELESRYLPNALSGYIFDGELFALPSELSNYVMWVNTQMLETAGVEVPRTWEEMSTIGQELMIRSGDQVTQEAIALPLNFPGAQFLVIDAMVRQAGGQLFSDDGREANLTSEPVLKAVTTLAGFVQTDKITDPALNGTTAGGDRDLFLNGVAAMMLTGGSWFRGNLVGTEVGEQRHARALPPLRRWSRCRRGSLRLWAHRQRELGAPSRGLEVHRLSGGPWHGLLRAGGRTLPRGHCHSRK